ncbi:hypothetical protein CR162_08175 [Pseudoroseomonas rhizosphaerae]|uniref:Uncharacterized protein n=1 Tax=Teichococcus rhizosphaerae TaxID=1335062 RepID=A0A2C7AEF2_9PROT|nr:hypothetical protein [Pseudoroseomonas rhizosphaerae]PHK95454.1 hypothetical protein CR162_08175 [Pseudoroseomonas rhizosphaerae]
MVRRCLVAALFASIFLQRFAIPIGEDGLAINLLVTLGVLALLAIRGAFTLDPVRTVMFFALGTAISLSTALNAGNASLPSMVLMLVMYAPFVLALNVTDGVFRGCVSAFQKMVLVCAVCGVAQFVAQFVVGSENLFTFHGLVPESLLLPNFNTANPLTWDSPYYKSNGFFLLEPSTFSQYLAIAIVLELLFYGVTLRLLAFAVALPTSYSGTGLILLLLLLPWLLLHLRAYGAIVGGLAFVGVAVIFGSLWNIEVLLNRINEFQSEDSSANARFVAGAWLIGEFLLSSARDVVFGLGPGSYAQHTPLVSYEAHDPAWAKMLFEYGLMGSAIFWPFFFISLFSNPPSRWISTALLIGYFTFGGMLLDPRLQIMILVFCVWPKQPAAAPAHERPSWAPTFNSRHAA